MNKNFHPDRHAGILLASLGFLGGVVLTVLFIPWIWQPKAPTLSENSCQNAQDTQEPFAEYGSEGLELSTFPGPSKNPIALESVEDELRTGPLPLEWEDPLFAVLDLKNMDQRNLALIQMATLTAKHVPRVQAECLAHLTFGLGEKDHAHFLSLARNEALPLESRLEFLEETFRIRRLEFSVWVAQNLANDPNYKVASVSRQFLADQKLRATSPAKDK